MLSSSAFAFRFQSKVVVAMIREFLAVAARAALEWALASLLLANGAAFCLIAAAAARLRLGPPCIICARVHRLLCSPATGEERDALRRLLCDAHLAAVAVPSSAPPDRCDWDSVSETEAAMAADDPNKVSGMETHRVVSIGSEICEQDQDGNKPDAGDRSSGTARTSSTDEATVPPLVSLFELAPFVSRPRPREDDESILIDRLATTMPESSLTVDDGGDESLTLGELVTAFRAQRRELHALRAELAAERRSRAEAEEYQRQLEEQGELDRDAARLAMQLVHESETEKHGLQPQLDACRVRAQLYRQSDEDAGGGGGGGGGCREANGGDGSGNNYQSLVDFLPGSVYSSSPDLANLLKLYTESGNAAGRRPMGDYYDVPAIAVVEEAEEEEEVAVADVVTVMAGTESSRSVDVDATSAAIVSESLQESSNTFHVETVTEAV